jgi:hypothetical protein
METQLRPEEFTVWCEVSASGILRNNFILFGYIATVDGYIHVQEEFVPFLRVGVSFGGTFFSIGRGSAKHCECSAECAQ